MGGIGATTTAHRQGEMFGARAQHDDALGAGGGGGGGKGADDRQVEGGGKGGAMGRENNNGGAAPAAGQGKRAMPANLGVGPENSFCQAKHRQDNGKCIYTGAKYS